VVAAVAHTAETNAVVTSRPSEATVVVEAVETVTAITAANQVMMRKLTNFENVYHIYLHIYRKFTSIYW
jgi:hypothetical protein